VRPITSGSRSGSTRPAAFSIVSHRRHATIRAIPPPYLLATKLEAFNGLKEPSAAVPARSAARGVTARTARHPHSFTAPDCSRWR
jgi:hypothetical protein